MRDTMEKLADLMVDMSPQMQRAASFVLDNPGSIAVDSMRTMAARADVSPPTMLRLAQRLGFDSYDQFRDVFKASVTRGHYGNRAQDLKKTADEGGISGLIASTVGSAESAMARFHDPVFNRDIKRAADTVLAARRSFVVASGASFGQAVSFQYVCRMALPEIMLVNGLGVRAVDEIASVGPGDVVVAISTSPYAMSTIQAADFAKRQGAEIVAITDRRASPVAQLAGTAVVIETASPHYFPSMISLNATLEIFSAVISVKRGADAVAEISAYEKELRRNGYYWKEP